MFCILSPEQREKIHQSALEILEKTGVIIKEKEILDVLRWTCKRKEQVKIPPSIVEGAIQKAPKRVVIYNREGEEKLILEGRKVYFGAHGDCPTILDRILVKE
jgi:trimethylamine--corrinoid protein Co-methyltransferase